METIKTYVIELTGQCNESCRFCYSISYDSSLKIPRKKSMGGNEWYQALKNIRDNGTDCVSFSGGEPTLHPDISDILKKAKESGLYVILSTNGTVNSNNVYDSIEKYVDCISLSLHGIGDTHDLITGKAGSYDKTIDFLRYFLNKRKVIKINTVLCPENKENALELGEIIDIENNSIKWKIIQAIPRESGLKNKTAVTITDEVFNSIREGLIKRFPNANNEKRLIFREDDSKHPFVPYLIADSEGGLYIPIGEYHEKLGISISDPNLNEKLSDRLRKYTNFSEKLKQNHDNNYAV